MKSLIALALAGSACFAGSILTTQADACLDSDVNCVGGASGTQHDGANFNTYAVSSQASYGILHVTASSTFGVTGGFALALGYVGFTDDLTITSPTHANGTSGQLTIGYYVDGTITKSGGGNAFLQVVARTYSLPSDTLLQNYVEDVTSSTAGNFVIPLTFNFTYGTPFELYLSMQATAGSVIDSGSGYSNPPVTASGSGSANFYNTLILNELQTSTDSTITSGSGTQYSQDGVVPEPGTLSLLLLASPVIVWRVRRGRANGKRAEQ